MKNVPPSEFVDDKVVFTDGYYLILFADLIGSTEVASEQSPDAYAKTYIASFRWAANRAIDFLKLDVWESSSELNFKGKINDISIIGDEVISTMKLISSEKNSRSEHNTDNNDDLNADIVASAVLFAYLIKLFWFVSPYNLNRLRSKQFTRDISVGIHIGPAGEIISDNDEEFKESNALNIAGLHINIAKRIETLAREGTSTRIFASEDVNHLFNNWILRFKKRDYKSQAPLRFLKFEKFGDRHFIKGLPRSIEVFELKWDTSSNDLLLMLKEFTTFDKNDIEAEQVLHTLGKAFFRLEPSDDCDNVTRYLDQAVIFNLDFQMNGAKEEGSLRQENCTVAAQAYIQSWFEAVESPPKVFLDELFISTSYFIISCALYRCHRGIVKHNESGVGSKREQAFQEAVDKLFQVARKFIESEK